MLSYVPNHSKQQNYKSDQITMNCIDLTSKRSKMLSYVPNHSKHSKTTKVIKLRWIAWIWRQNEQKCWVTSQTIQNNAKLQKWSNYDELHRFDVKTIKMLSYVPNHSKQLKPTKVIKLQWIASIWCQKHQTTQNYKSDQITMKCMDLTSKRTKMLSYVANHSKQRKSTKFIKVQWIASIWCQKHQTTQNYKSDQITMNCIDLTSKRSKMLSYVPNHSKHSKTTKVIKLRWIASIWCRKTCWVTNHSKHSKTTKVIKLRWIAWIWRQNEQKCWVTSQTIQNNANLQKLSNYNELHRFDVKNIKQRKTTKVIKLRWSAWIWRQNEQKCWVTSQTIQNKQNYKSDQITMNCIDLTSKR